MSFGGTLLVFLSAILVSCGSQKNQQAHIQSHAPVSKDSVGVLLTLKDPKLSQHLESWAIEKGIKVRPIYPAQGLYEVFTDISTVREQFPNSSTSQNQLFKALNPEGDTGFDISDCKGGFPTPQPVIQNMNFKERMALFPIFQLGEGPFKFSGSQSLSSDSSKPELLWKIIGPKGSIVSGRASSKTQLQIFPDLPGEYQVHLIARNKSGVCELEAIRFGVTSNPELKTLPPARDITDKDLSLFAHLSVLDTETAWAKSSGDEIQIAIIDSGVNFNHPDLRQNIALNENEIPNNGIDDDQNGFIDDYLGWDFSLGDPNPADDNGHGTHVASLAASAVTGIARNAKILPIKAINTFGQGDDGTLAAAIIYAVDRGADIINASFGSPIKKGEDPPEVLVKALDYAEEHGVVFVVSAGNGDLRGIGFNIDRKKVYPASAKHSNVITVAAAKPDGGLSPYSNYGVKSVEVAAPGGSRVDGAIMGAHYIPEKQKYIALSGTSMSAPIVSGIVALVLDLNHSLTPSQVSDRLLNSGEDIPELKTRVKSGKLLTAGAAVSSTFGETR